MHRNSYYRRKDVEGSKMIGLLSKLFLCICAIAFFAWFGIYMVLAFAETIDGEDYRQNGEHLKKLMEIEQSGLRAAKHIQGGN